MPATTEPKLTRSEARRMRLVAQGLDGAARAGRAVTSPGAALAAAVRLETASHAEPGPARRGLDGSTAAGPTPPEVVRRMVAMQGQDLPQVLRAIAVRSAPGTTLADVRAAFDAGELVRSWAMRGTLFVATPDDLATIHAATADRLRRQEWRLCTDRGIDATIAQRAADVLVEQLAGGPRTRPAVLAAWEAAGVETTGGRGYHLLALCAYDGLVQFGPFDGDAQLLVGGEPLAVPEPHAALAEALGRFVAARGPIPADDAAWWTGLPKSLVREALAGAEGLERVLVDGEPMLVAADAEPGRRTGVRLVPGFDEWVLGYRDRSHTASPAMLQAMVPGGNGVFKPLVLVDGRAVAVWRWPLGKGARSASPVLEVVEAVSPSVLAGIERALQAWPHR